jgi:hypothetical protein
LKSRKLRDFATTPQMPSPLRPPPNRRPAPAARLRLPTARETPHEGSATIADDLYSVASLATNEAYRPRLRDDAAARQAFARSEGRLFLSLASAPHAPLVRA